MAYELHITRKPDWHGPAGPEITLQDWLRYVGSDPEMRMDGYAEAPTSAGTIRIERAGMAVWVAYSGHGRQGKMACFTHFKDRVSVKDPDEEIIKKMHRIAQALNAKVFGDQGELYGADGTAAKKPGKPQQPHTQQQAQAPAAPEHSEDKPWWKVWN